VFYTLFTPIFPHNEVYKSKPFIAQKAMESTSSEREKRGSGKEAH
jgi:hypothetical protein